jgi:hypothetical protein
MSKRALCADENRVAGELEEAAHRQLDGRARPGVRAGRSPSEPRSRAEAAGAG